MLQGKGITAVAAAKRHTVVLTAEGDVHTWGHKVVTPKRVQLAGGLHAMLESRMCSGLLAVPFRADALFCCEGSASRFAQCTGNEIKFSGEICSHETYHTAYSDMQITSFLTAC